MLDKSATIGIWEMAVHLAVTGYVFDGVLICDILMYFFPLDVLEDLGLNWVISWEFSYLLFLM